MAEASSQPRSLGLVLLLVLAATSFAIFWWAEAAEATVLCKTESNPCSGVYGRGTALNLKLQSGTKTVIKNGGFTYECEASEITGLVQNVGDSTSSVISKIEFRKPQKCNVAINVLKRGDLEVRWEPGSSDGTLVETGAEITYNSSLVSCTYGGPVTLGTLKAGKPAILEIDTWIPKVAGGGLCANPVKLTASYEVTSPEALYVAQERQPLPATRLCNTPTNPCTVNYGAGSLVAANLKAGTKWTLSAGFANFTCEEAGLTGKIVNAGGGKAGEAVSGDITAFMLGKCSNEVKVLNDGSFTAAWTSGSNGTFTAEDLELTVTYGTITCTYVLPAASLIGGAMSSLKPEVMMKVSGGFLCANPAKLAAEYTVTSPEPLYVSNG